MNPVLALDPLFNSGDITWSVFAVVLIKVVVAFALLLVSVMLYIWGLRKVIADMQNRIGPNRAGPYGVLQTLADGIKLFFKEQSIPSSADRPVFRLAPYLSLLPAFLMFCIIPIGGEVSILGHHTFLQVADLPIGALWILAMSGIGVYGIMLAGWASGSKYPLLGSVRATAQLLSYEAAFGLAVLGVLIQAGTLSTHAIVDKQAGMSWHAFLTDWYWIPAIVPFIIFLIAASAETNHPPFDLVEAEQELVGGFNTEYTGIRFAIFFLAEFMNVITMSAVAVTLFLGGPYGPGLGFLGARRLRERLDHAGVLVHGEGARAAVLHGVGARVVAAHALRPAHVARLEVPDRDRDPLGARVRGARGRAGSGLERLDRGTGRRRRRRCSRSVSSTSRCRRRASSWRSSADESPFRVLGHAAPDGQAAPHDGISRGEVGEAAAPARSSRPQPLRGRHGEVHRLRAVRGRVPGAVHLRPRRRQPDRRSGLAG